MEGLAPSEVTCFSFQWPPWSVKAREEELVVSDFPQGGESGILSRGRTGFPRRKTSRGTQHIGWVHKQSGSFPRVKPAKTEFFLWVIFSSLPLSPVLKQVCCCFHNPGEEIEPLSAETSGAKPNCWTDTPSWLPVPWRTRAHGKFWVRNPLRVLTR